MDKKEMPMHKKAKLSVLKDLRQMAMDMIHERGMEGEDEMGSEKMQKVMVAAKDKEGLKKGLEKAEDVLESMPGEESEDEESEDMESPEKSLDEQEQELLAKLEEIRSKKQQA